MGPDPFRVRSCDCSACSPPDRHQHFNGLCGKHDDEGAGRLRSERSGAAVLVPHKSAAKAASAKRPLQHGIWTLLLLSFTPPLRNACHSQVRRPLRNISVPRGVALDHAASRCGLRAARLRPCRAAAEAETATAEEDAAEAIADAPPPGPIPYAQDTETFQDVFAFSGALPEVRSGVVKPVLPCGGPLHEWL